MRVFIGEPGHEELIFTFYQTRQMCKLIRNRYLLFCHDMDHILVLVSKFYIHALK